MGFTTTPFPAVRKSDVKLSLSTVSVIIYVVGSMFRGICMGSGIERVPASLGKPGGFYHWRGDRKDVVGLETCFSPLARFV